MSRWLAWGDFAYTLPERIGNASVQDRNDASARKAADAAGFAFKQRLRNGFQPWAASFTAENDDGQEDAFAAYPIVRGWRRI